MRHLLAMTLALLILLAPARVFASPVESGDMPDGSADDDAATFGDESEDPHDPCACCCRRHLDSAHTSAMILGISLLGTGYLLSAAHAFTQADLRYRYVELLPLAGAIDGVARDDRSPAWATTLMFAAWSQAMGVLVLSVAFGEK
jgi:hypothetical protein